MTINISRFPNLKKICKEKEVNYKALLKASVIQTYLRLSGEMKEYINPSEAISVVEFIEEAKTLKLSDVVPFKIELTTEELSINFKDKIDKKIEENLEKCVCNVVLQMLDFGFINDIHLLSDEEEDKVIEASTGEKLVYDNKLTWVDSFVLNAKKHPDSIAVVDATGSYTYGQLDELSNKFANYLLDKGFKDNDFIALPIHRVKEYWVALTGANKAGGAYIPIDPEYPQDLRKYMVDKAGARFVFDEKDVRKVIDSASSAKAVNKSAPGKIAYMIFTSGTTGNPKGVMMPHSAVRHLAEWVIPLYKLDETKRNVVHPSLSFDASVPDTIFPLIAGGRTYVVDEKTRMSFKDTAKFINDNKITGFNASYAVGRELLNRYDLNIEYIVMGGEAFLPLRKQKFMLINAYGPTEFAVQSSVHIVDQDKEQLPPIGRAAPGTIDFVLDCFLHPVPLGIPGELCLSGPQISKGYCNNEEATKKNFVRMEDGRKIYRTGDLVRYNDNLELDYMGRIDRQVKIRGFRIEPAQIENKALEYGNITNVVVVPKKINKSTKLCLYYTSKERIDTRDLKKFLSKGLTEYMVPEAYMELKTLPKTVNGKVDTKKLPDPVVYTKGVEYVPASTELENQFCMAVSAILDVENVGIKDDFFELGGDSLSAMELVQELDLPMLDISDIYLGRNVKDIIDIYHHKKNVIPDKDAIYMSEEGTLYPMVGAQIHFDNILRTIPDSTSCNIQGLYQLKSYVDADRLKVALNTLLHTHYAFANRFVFINGKTYQTYFPDSIKKVSVEYMTEEEVLELQKTFVKPYDIYKEMTYRFRLIKTNKHLYLFADMLHLITDGYSMDIFWKNLEAIYKGDTVEKDNFYPYLFKQDKLRKTSYYSKIEEQITKEINDESRVKLVPFDHQNDEFDAGAYEHKLNMTDKELEALCQKYSLTPNTYFMGCYLLALAKFTGQDKVCVSWIYNGRDSADVANTIGLMINVLYVFCDVDYSRGVKEYFDMVNEKVNESMSRQAYNGYAIRDLMKEPIGVFQYHNGFTDTETKDTLIKKYINLPNPYFKPAFFWEFNVSNTSEGLGILGLINRERYDEATLKDFVVLFAEIIEKISKGIDKLDEI